MTEGKTPQFGALDGSMRDFRYITGANILERGGGFTAEQGRAAHDHPRRAEAALHGVVIDERLLNGVELVADRPQVRI